ncbi:hypothetical protein O181_103617 [Austropuccinia psidii MF-1]|uniref:Uncharacterized protein n=1 Tax=Austropuccinia psidii MF-1 TaxID=1389203 RepID=A0A9Q3PKM1_9BASI|nr:hypothetical protein [Austropuccinia psidii MF-1]
MLLSENLAMLSFCVVSVAVIVVSNNSRGKFVTVNASSIVFHKETTSPSAILATGAIPGIKSAVALAAVACIGPGDDVCKSNSWFNSVKSKILGTDVTNDIKAKY